MSKTDVFTLEFFGRVSNACVYKCLFVYVCLQRRKEEKKVRIVVVHHSHVEHIYACVITSRILFVDFLLTQQSKEMWENEWMNKWVKHHKRRRSYKRVSDISPMIHSIILSCLSNWRTALVISFFIGSYLECVGEFGLYFFFFFRYVLSHPATYINIRMYMPTQRIHFQIN